MPISLDIQHAPGHLIRRAQQMAVAVFMEEAAAFDVTPVQYAILNALMDTPGVDQVTLAARVAFDPATSGSVIARLELKGWVRRESDPRDKRRKLLWLTSAGEQAVEQMTEAVRETQRRIVAPLTPKEQAQLIELLDKLVAGHEAQR